MQDRWEYPCRAPSVRALQRRATAYDLGFWIPRGPRGHPAPEACDSCSEGHSHRSCLIEKRNMSIRSSLPLVEISEDIRAVHPSVPLPILRTLIRRGFTTSENIEQYLYPNYARDVHDPFLFKDMNTVVERLAKAATNNELVMIHGDYDADGVTSSAILSTMLKMLGVRHEVFLPHRQRDGYGVSEETVVQAVERGVNVLITADCGVASIVSIAYAKDHGVDVIVVDHHERKEELPAAIAIIHPLVDEGYPDRTLTGGGAAFKVLQAIVRTDHPVIVAKREVFAQTQPTDFRWEGFEKWMLDLVAISTVADCTKLVGESRALVYWGLKVLEKMRRPGIRALCEHVRKGPMDARTIGFTIAPRLNAPGRLDHANLALELLLEEDEQKVIELASRVEALNVRRQELTSSATQEALAVIGLEPRSAVVAYGKEWPLGIVGIVAARLSDKFQRPAFVMTQNDGKIVGSARAPQGYSVLALLEQAQEFLSRFGGHQQAGGFTVHSEGHIDGFRAALELAGVNAPAVSAEQQQENAGERIDDEVLLSDITDELASWVGKCEPFGQGNPPVQFLVTDCELVNTRIFKDGKHAEFMVRQNGTTRRMVGFTMGEAAKKLRSNAVVDILFEVRFNEYRGMRNVECIVNDIKQV